MVDSNEESPNPSGEGAEADENSFVFIEEDLSSKNEEDLRSALLKNREETRSEIAKNLVKLLGITVASIIILSGIMVFRQSDELDQEEQLTYSKDIFSILLSTQTGLIGAALGFYFGSKEDG